MDNNVTIVLAAALVDLQNIVAASRKGRIALLPIFDKRADKNVSEFVKQLEIVFLANQITDNRKFHIGVSCLTGIVINWYKLN